MEAPADDKQVKRLKLADETAVTVAAAADEKQLKR